MEEQQHQTVATSGSAAPAAQHQQPLKTTSEWWMWKGGGGCIIDSRDPQQQLQLSSSLVCSGTKGSSCCTAPAVSRYACEPLCNSRLASADGAKHPHMPGSIPISALASCQLLSCMVELYEIILLAVRAGWRSSDNRIAIAPPIAGQT